MSEVMFSSVGAAVSLMFIGAALQMVAKTEKQWWGGVAIIAALLLCAYPVVGAVIALIVVGFGGSIPWHFQNKARQREARAEHVLAELQSGDLARRKAVEEEARQIIARPQPGRVRALARGAFCVLAGVALIGLVAKGVDNLGSPARVAHANQVVAVSTKAKDARRPSRREHAKVAAKVVVKIDPYCGPLQAAAAGGESKWIDEVTYFRGLTVDCEAKTFTLTKDVFADRPKFESAWLAIQQRRWSALNCKDAEDRQAMKAGWKYQERWIFSEKQTMTLEARCEEGRRNVSGT